MNTEILRDTAGISQEMKSKGTNIIRFDWAIKRLLRQKANFGILAGFLSELLKDDIRIDEILESESNQETADDKFNKVDILVKNSKDELMIIEIQNNMEIDYFQRMLYGVCKTVSQTINAGEKYRAIKKVYSINILYFNLGKGDDYVFHATTLFKGLHTGATLALSDDQQKLFHKKYPEELFPEYYIIDVTQFDNVAKSTLDEWIYYLKNSAIQSDFTAKGLLEAMQTLNELLMSPQEREVYERFIMNRVIAETVLETSEIVGIAKGEIIGIEKGKIEGEIIGIEKGKIEGERIAKTNIVLAGLKKGASVEFLADISELSLEEVQQIIDEYGNIT